MYCLEVDCFMNGSCRLPLWFGCEVAARQGNMACMLSALWAVLGATSLSGSDTLLLCALTATVLGCLRPPVAAWDRI